MKQLLFLLLLQVFVLAATNLPWELDQALLRRLDKRVMVDLPDSAAREGMLRVSRGPGLHNYLIPAAGITASWPRLLHI